MINSLPSDAILNSLSYLSAQDLCRAAPTCRTFRDIWNDASEWASRFRALPYSRIFSGLPYGHRYYGPGRFALLTAPLPIPWNIHHLAFEYPRVVDRILSFLSSRDAEAVALADRTMRFVTYTHPTIKPPVRIERQRFLAIEYRKIPLSVERELARNAAVWWMYRHKNV